MTEKQKVEAWTKEEYTKYIKDPAKRIYEVWDMGEIASSEIGLMSESDDIRAWIHDTLAEIFGEE